MTVLLLIAALGLWHLATRLAPDMLRPGHGALWLPAALGPAVAWAVLAALAAPEAPALWLSERLGVAAAGPGAALTHLALALLTLLATFAAARLLFALLRPRRPDRPPLPGWFVVAGVTRAGAPLEGFRAAARGLLLTLTLVLSALPLASGLLDTTSWAAALAALLAGLFAVTHPARGAGAAAEATGRARPPAPTDAAAPRFDALHAWLGAPPEHDRLPALTPDAPAPASLAPAGLPPAGIPPGIPGSPPPTPPWCPPGFAPYPYQAALLGHRRPPAIALAGPVGSGRTTAAVLAGLREILESGAAAAVLTPTAAAAEAAAARARTLLADGRAAAAVAVQAGDRPGDADLWCASLADLEAFLGGCARLDRQGFARRLALIVVTDAEALSGYGIPQARFLVHRLGAAGEAGRPGLVITGDLGEGAMDEAARAIAASEVALVATGARPGGAAAASLPVRRYVVTAPPEGDVAEDLARLEGEGGFRAALAGAPWPARAPLDGDAPDVSLVRVGPETAWRVLGRRRLYAPGRPGRDHAREYLVFGGDPMARLLAREGGEWPAWFDARQFPRMLTSVPGDLDAPAGLLALARRHLRAALAEAPQDASRLDAVFSAPVVAAELAAIRESGLLLEGVGWAPGPGGVTTHRRVSLDGTAAEGRAPGDLAVLREPRSGRTFEVRRGLLDLVYHDRAIVTLDGQRYEVRDGGDGAERVLVPAPHRFSAPIRDTRVRRLAGAPLAETRHRFRGPAGIVALSGRVGLDITHHGARHFTLDQRRVHEILAPAPRQLAPFVTSARILCPPTEDAAVLHTLTHVLREVLPYFYLGAEDSLGVTWAGAEELGRAGVVLYDRHPDGLGNVYDVVDGLDWLALLSAAAAVLEACACQASCAGCGESTTCTATPHNTGLDRHATLAVLARILGDAPRAVAVPLRMTA